MRNLYVDWLFLIPTGIFLALVVRLAEWFMFVPRYSWQTRPDMSWSLLVSFGFIFMLFFTRHQRRMRMAHHIHIHRPRNVAHMWGVFESIALGTTIFLGSLVIIDGIEYAIEPEQYFEQSSSFYNVVSPEPVPLVYPTETRQIMSTRTPRPRVTRIDVAATREANAAALRPYVPATTTPEATPAESEPISITITHQHNQMGTITTDDPAVPEQ